MAIGEKGGVQASKVLSQTAYDAFCDHSLIEECWDYYKKLNVPDYDTLKV